MSASEDGSSTAITFMVAIAITMLSIFAVFNSSDNVVSINAVMEVEQVNLQSEAASLNQILLGTSGVVDSGGSWDGGESSAADNMTRLGLLDPSGKGIQLEKLRNLRLAPYDANETDGYVNYQEVREALGLNDKGLDFHIRAKPTLRSMESILEDPEEREPNLKITYIANVESTTSGGGAIDDGLGVSDFQCEAADHGGPSWRFSVNITNGGTEPTQFLTVWEIDGGSSLTRQDVSGIIDDGDTQTVHVDVENVDGFTCDSGTEVDLDIIDSVQLLRSESLAAPTVGTEPTTASDQFWLQTSASAYNASQDIQLFYGGEVKKDDEVALLVWEGAASNGTAVHYENDSVPAAKKDRFLTIAGGTLDKGEYTAYMAHEDGVIATQRLVVVDTLPGAYVTPNATGTTTYEEDPAVASEVQYLNDLVEQFCPTYYDGKTESPIGATWADRCSFKNDLDAAVVGPQPGDVVPDLKPDMRQLQYRLLEPDGTPRYDITTTLVIGSNIAHNAMTSADIKDPIRDWVLGGGTLIVFGSPDQSTQWLQSIFHVGQTSSSGGISAPDVSHPLLTTPESLAYDQYTTSGKGWKYTGGAEDHFTDVVQEGSTPVTAVSDPGDFGQGTIVLTSWRPYDLFGDGPGTSGSEGMRIMFNFIMRDYVDLFLDYGPPIPEGTFVIPAVGRSVVNHDSLGPIPLDIVLYVFQSSSE